MLCLLVVIVEALCQYNSNSSSTDMNTDGFQASWF